MAGARLHRLARELELLRTDPPPGVAAWPVDEADISRFHASIQGPEGTPYEDGVFRLELELSERYPFEPPMVRFITPIYHPNIDERGRICLDTLKPQPQGSWSPSLNLPALLTTIRLLLAHPNAEDGLVPEATEVYRRDPQAFDRVARQHTARHATAAAAGVEAQQQRQHAVEGNGDGMQGVTAPAFTRQEGGGEEDNGDQMKIVVPSSQAAAEAEATGAGPNPPNPAAAAALEAVQDDAGAEGQMEEAAAEEEDEDEEEEGGPLRWDSDVSVCGEDEGSCCSADSSLGDGDGMGVGMAGRRNGIQEPHCKARGANGLLESEMFVVSAEGLPPSKRARRR